MFSTLHADYAEMQLSFIFFRIHLMIFEYMYFETVVFNTEKLKCFWPKEAIENHNISEF